VWGTAARDVATPIGTIMDFWEFVARSEWPIVVGGAIWLLRRPLQDMLSRVTPTKVDAFGLKAEFERTLDKVEQLTAPTDQRPAQIDDVLPASPEAVILDSWRQLENAVREKLPSKGRNILVPPKATELERQLNLSEDEIAAYQSLRKMRNQVAHENAPVSREDAIRFKEAAQRLLQRFVTAQQGEVR
jgi:hypothetical protein